MSKGIFAVEKYFRKKENLEEILKVCRLHLNKIDHYSKILRLRPDNVGDLENIMIKLVGEQGFLEPILGLAITYKKNEEEKTYMGIKIKIENEGRKFSSAPTEREASAYVAEWRRIRNILQAYVDVCKASISAIQTRLKTVRE